MDKLHKGQISEWRIIDVDGQGDIITGRFLDHPELHGTRGHTSAIVSHDVETGEVETLNSRYTLVGDAEGPRIAYGELLCQIWEIWGAGEERLLRAIFGEKTDDN